MLFYAFPVPPSTHLCTKLQVPSTGSIIQVGLSVRTHFEPAAVDSSAINLYLMWNKNTSQNTGWNIHSLSIIPSFCLLKRYLFLYKYTFHIYVYIWVHTYFFFHWGMGNFYRNFRGEFSNSQHTISMVKKNSIHVHFPNVPLRNSWKWMQKWIWTGSSGTLKEVFL